MLVLKLIMCILVFFVIPSILGILITKFTNKKHNILFAYVIGFLLEFAILQILAIPMIFLKLNFKILLYSWICIICVLTILSLIVNKNKIKELRIKESLKKIFNKSNIICVVAILFVFFQACYSLSLTYTNADDAFFVGTANTSIYSNTMYKISPETGNSYGKLPARYVLAPFPIYLAIISSILNINPAIVAHTIFQPVFILLAYAIYTLLGEKLFCKDKTNVSIFIILLSIINIFGNYSDRTNFSYLLLRIWQGKAVLSSIMLPAIWLVFLNCIEDDKKNANWGILFITILASTLVSEMGIALSPMTLMFLAFVFSIRDKKISYLLKSAICVIPCIVYFLIYLLVK